MPDNGIDPLTFPGYRLVVELGSGHNGTVYRARELETQRLVALKIYRPEAVRKAGFVSGLDSAVLLARKLKHPAAAEVFGLAETREGGGVALVMELVGGEVLSRALQRNVRFSVVRAMRLAADLAGALDAAHAAKLSGGIIHPGHIVIYGESAKLLGVGWSAVEGLPSDYDHLPEAGRFAPAAYAAPEVLSGARPSASSDVFALGAVLYHMLTGLVPFRARDLAGLKLERTEGLRWPRGADSLISSEAIGLVGRTLELDPALRPGAAQFAAAVSRLLSGARPENAGANANEVSAAPVSAPISSEILPPEPGRQATLPPPPRSSSGRIRDMLVGSVAAALFIAAGLGLGRLVWGGPPAPTGNPRSTPNSQGPVAANPDQGETTPAPQTDPARQEWQAILAVLKDKPGNLEAVKKRLAELARKHKTSPWGLRAQTRLDELVAEQSRARLRLYRDVTSRAGKLEKGGKFGAALKLLDPPPLELAGTELAARCAEEARHLRKRVARRFDEISARAERSVADGDRAAAILDYQAVADDFGVEAYAAKARKRIRELGDEMERIAAQSTRQREEIRRAKAEKKLKAGISQARSLIGSFEYANALKVLGKLARDAEQPPAARKLVKRYAELVGDEEKLFKRAARRVANGIKELTISVGNSEVLTVKKLDAKGMIAEGTTIKTTFKWERVPGAQIYRAFKLTIDVTNAEEHLALATFAWHRGQKLEMENGLKLAGELDAALKDKAGAQAQVYAGIDALVLPRRAAKSALPGAVSPRRRKAD
jgi:eukaryotic-like serine/threonine-protein kinase